MNLYIYIFLIISLLGCKSKKIKEVFLGKEKALKNIPLIEGANFFNVKKDTNIVELKNPYPIAIVGINPSPYPIVGINPSNIKSDTTIIKLKNSNSTILDIYYNNDKNRELIIKIENKTISIIEVPSHENYSGFSINWIRENKDGFEISIEFGTRNYFEKIFYFSYEGNSFFLKKISTKGFDKNNSSSKNSFFNNQKILEKPLDVKKFKLKKYITFSQSSVNN